MSPYNRVSFITIYYGALVKIVVVIAKVVIIFDITKQIRSFFLFLLKKNVVKAHKRGIRNEELGIAAQTECRAELARAMLR